jgi:2-polyprenyl-6-methoxyphenol hydroxylase-like FAD-dependent oxidoreductase
MRHDALDLFELTRRKVGADRLFPHVADRAELRSARGGAATLPSVEGVFDMHRAYLRSTLSVRGEWRRRGGVPQRRTPKTRKAGPGPGGIDNACFSMPFQQLPISTAAPKPNPMSHPGKPFEIIVLGGGTAGWMAACLMAKRWAGRNVSITAIESSDIGIIGVGEGSTPQLKAFFTDLGLDERAWMPQCHATYKNGISFHGWSEAKDAPSYFHPFPSPIDAHTAPAFHYNSFMRRRGVDMAARPDRFFLSAKLAEKRLAPLAARNFPFELAYGYHFDAFLVGQLLRERAKALGVRHIDAKATRVLQREDGSLRALRLDGERELAADFFVDATGFRSLLLQETLGVPFHSYKENLFNDSAVVMPTPTDPTGLSSATRAIAMRHGWRWEIPLTNRSGNGYVYSSAFCSPDEAETELRTSLGLLDSDVAARHLKMKVGRVEQHWAKNCLAVGLSQGFIEPLEATALHLVQATVETFIDRFEAGGFTNRREAEANATINARFEGVRDYIVCHYKMNRRTDTDYWRQNAANRAISDSLASLLDCWRAGGDIREEVRRQNIARYYTDMSWVCMLGGYGHYPTALRAPTVDEARFDMAVIDDFVDRCALNFPEHRAVLEG